MPEFYPCRNCRKLRAYEPDCLCDICKPKQVSPLKTSCVLCRSTKVARSDFDSDISWEEFTFSGLCQACQDETIGKRNIV